MPTFMATVCRVGYHNGVEIRGEQLIARGHYDFISVVVSDDALVRPGNGIFSVARVAKTRLTWCWINS